MKTLFIALLVVWLALATAATISVLRRSSIPRNKRLPLILLAWLLPIVGAILAICLAGRTKSAPMYPQASADTMAIDVLASGSTESATRSDDDRH
jgi:hypothetical protein